MTISGQNNYAYDIYGYNLGYETAYVDDFKRTASTGSLDHWKVALSNPPTYDSNWSWMQFGAEADPTNHVPVFEMQEQVSYGAFAFPQLASYTMDSSGNLTTTNTYRNMPATSVYPDVMNMSPSGKLLAIGSNVDYSACCGRGDYAWGTTGLQVFHFSGANPITPYSKTLTTTPIDSIHWDKSKPSVCPQLLHRQALRLHRHAHKHHSGCGLSLRDYQSDRLDRSLGSARTSRVGMAKAPSH